MATTVSDHEEAAKSHIAAAEVHAKAATAHTQAAAAHAQMHGPTQAVQTHTALAAKHAAASATHANIAAAHANAHEVKATPVDGPAATQQRAAGAVLRARTALRNATVASNHAALAERVQGPTRSYVQSPLLRTAPGYRGYRPEAPEFNRPAPPSPGWGRAWNGGQGWPGGIPYPGSWGGAPPPPDQGYDQGYGQPGNDNIPAGEERQQVDEEIRRHFHGISFRPGRKDDEWGQELSQNRRDPLTRAIIKKLSRMAADPQEKDSGRAQRVINALRGTPT